MQLLTPDPQNRRQTILGAFTGLLSGYSQCRCRDKIKNMDFGVSLGYGGRAAAETFIFLFSRLPRVCARKCALRMRIRYACAMYLKYYYLFFTCTMYYVLLSICHLRARGQVRIFFYFLLWTPRVRDRAQVGARRRYLFRVYTRILFNLFNYYYIYTYIWRSVL